MTASGVRRAILRTGRPGGITAHHPLDNPRKDPAMTRTRRAREDADMYAFLRAIRESAFTWDPPTAWTGLSERTDTITFPRIVLAGTVVG